MPARDIPLIEAPCPHCGAINRLQEREWVKTFKVKFGEYKDLESGRKVHGIIPGTGPETIISCVHCYAKNHAGVWHRTFERQELAKAGWMTPRTQHDQVAHR